MQCKIAISMMPAGWLKSSIRAAASRIVPVSRASAVM